MEDAWLNFVNFRSPQLSLNYEIKLRVIDNSTNISSGLEGKEYIKYLGVLIDNHLSWKYHVDCIAVKISKIVGVISRLRRFVPFCTLRSIYQSQAAIKAHLNKLLLFLLQKRELCLMYFLIQELMLFLFFYFFKNLTHSPALL